MESHPGETKYCPACGEVKPLSGFYRAGGKGHNAGRPRAYCKRCFSSKSYESRKKSPERAARHNRATYLRGRYQITVEEYQALVESQQGQCAICGRRGDEIPGRRAGLCIDHNHGTGKARSLLCSPCNLGLGMFGDDPDRIQQAAAYLVSHRSSELGEVAC